MFALLFGRLNDRKVPPAPCVAALDRFRHQGYEHMGELISLAERRTARAEAHAPPIATARELLLRPRVAVDVPGRRARGPAVRRCALAAGHRRGASGGRDAGAQRGAVAERAEELQMPPVWPRCRHGGRSAMRVAALAVERGRAADSCWPPAAWRSAAATTSTIPRSSPTRRPPPTSAWPSACRPPAKLRRDGPLEQAALRLLSQGADALPVLVVGRALFCGEHRLRRGGRRRQRAPRGAAAGAPHASAAER